MVGTMSYFKINSGVKNKDLLVKQRGRAAVRNEETGLRTARDCVSRGNSAPLGGNRRFCALQSILGSLTGVSIFIYSMF